MKSVDIEPSPASTTTKIDYASLNATVSAGLLHISIGTNERNDVLGQSPA